jgi:hypothetical protein
MEDPALNRRIDEIRELQTRWGQFHDFFTMAIKGGGTITSEAERAFLDLKTRICMLHDSFVGALKHDFKVGQQVLSLLGQCILLRRLPLMNNAEVQKIELEWNEAYMLMNETIAGLEEERQRLANVNEKAYKLNKYRELVMAKIHNVFLSGWFILIFFGVVIPGFIIFGVPAFGIYEWSRLKHDIPVLRFVQNPIEDMIRGYIDADYPYDEVEKIPVQEVKAQSHRDNQNRARTITPEYFVSQLVNIGFNKPQLDDAKAIFGKRKAFIKEARTNNYNRGEMVLFGILFDSTADARQFLDLRRKGLASYDKMVQDRVGRTVWVGRVSNFVIITVSENEELRSMYPVEKWKVREKDRNL